MLRTPVDCYTWHGQLRQGLHAAHLHPPALQPHECRAYKLGKKRWSYNQVELVLGEVDGGSRTAAIQEVVHAKGTKFQEASW
jgi:hypothetical protein